MRPSFCYNPPMRIIGLAGWSGAGKTTLVAKLIPSITARGLTVSTVKHAHHAFDVDQPGKDSYMHRMAGATEVLVSSQNRFALMRELRGAPELLLTDLLAIPADVALPQARVPRVALDDTDAIVDILLEHAATFAAAPRLNGIC